MVRRARGQREGAIMAINFGAIWAFLKGNAEKIWGVVDMLLPFIRAASEAVPDVKKITDKFNEVLNRGENEAGQWFYARIPAMHVLKRFFETSATASAQTANMFASMITACEDQHLDAETEGVVIAAQVEATVSSWAALRHLSDGADDAAKLLMAESAKTEEEKAAFRARARAKH